jgi:hypothetical protein
MTRTLRALLSLSLVWASSPLPAFAADVQKGVPGVPTRALALQRPAASVPSVPLARAAFPVLGSAAAPVAVEAAVAVEVSAAAAKGETKDSSAGVFSFLKTAVVDAFSGTRVFDAAKPSAEFAGPVGAMGLRPLQKPNLPQGVTLDQGPAAPAASIKKLQSGRMSFNRELSADPASEQDVERALRAIIDREAVVFESVKSQDLRTVHVRLIKGKAGLADTIYAVFQQQSAGIAVDGSQISFMIKVIAGKPVIVDAETKVFPNLSVQTAAKYNDDELKTRAERKLNLPQGAGVEYTFIERKILFLGNAWRAVNLYAIDGAVEYNGLMSAVDVNSGEAFAWDARHGIAALPPIVSPAASFPAGGARASVVRSPSNGKADVYLEGQGENKDTRPNGKPELVNLPLPHIYATIDGQKMTATKDGGIPTNATGELKAKLEGRWAVVNDQQRKPVEIAATVKDGENVIVANADVDDLTRINQINMYVWISKIHDWWSERLQGDKRIDRQLPLNVNINQDCNAYYTPGRPSLNFFKESRRCSDTGRPGIGAHEYGHFVDDMLGGIKNGGMSEGWGDIGSMFLLGTPIIGDGFLKGQNPSYIRHGENNYQYGKWDEVHDQGQAWMGFAWKLRKALIAKLGEAAGSAAAEALIVPTILAKASDIPGQIAKVLLNAQDKDGKALHEDEIRAAAKAHGIDLPGKKKAQPSLWSRLLSAFSTSASVEVITVSGQTRYVYVKASSEELVRLQGAIDTALSKQTMEYRGVAHAVAPDAKQLTIALAGDAASMDYAVRQIKRLAGVDEN